MRAILLTTSLLLSEAALAAGRGNIETEMQPFEVNGLHLVDAEYLPFIGSERLRYPEDVLFGFYAPGSTDSARACALKAYHQIKATFIERPSELDAAIAAGATPYFHLWIDDYSQAAADRSRREADVWHWDQVDRDYARGYWRWEAVTTQSGLCVLPTRERAIAAFKRATDVLSFAGRPGH